MFEAFSRYQSLSPEQRVLVAGRGADARTCGGWQALLDDVAGFEGARRDALKIATPLLVVAGVVSLGLVGLGVARLLDGGVAVGLALGAMGLVVFLAPFELRRWLTQRRSGAVLEQLVLPFVTRLREELGEGTPLYLWLRLDEEPASQESPVRFFEGATQLPDGTLLHFGAREVAENGRARCWLRATVSWATAPIEPHALEDQSPTVSGITRAVAGRAEQEGNPFTSMEMLALREAHGIQRQLALLEAFEGQEVPPPPVGDVVGEASRPVDGGRDDPAVSAAVLLELRRAAEGGQQG